MTKILVTAKVNPDLDGTACILAYSDLLNKTGKKAEGFVFGSYQSEVKYFVEKHGVRVPTKRNQKLGRWDNFVLVDASSMKGMPRSVIATRVIEIIDHRVGEPEKEFSNAKIQIDLIGAAATIVVERFIDLKISLEPDHAKLLYGAVYHNTLNFIATNSTKRDKDAAAFLESKYNLNRNLVREMFDYSTREIENNVVKSLEDDAKEYFVFDTTINARQLVVWGEEVFAQKHLVEKTVEKLCKNRGSEWAFVNIVNLESKKSSIYTNSGFGEKVLSKALGVEFSGGWATLPAILRKQIMPRVNEVINR